MSVAMLLAGLVALVFGAGIIVRYGTRLAERLGISPFIVGLTVIAVGTSTPELAVGIQAMSQGQASLVLGNIVGASLVNLLLFLGLVSAIRPVMLDQQTLRLDLPAMVGAATLVLLLSLDGTVSRGEGIVLLGVALLYTALLVRAARRQAAQAGPAAEIEAAEELAEELLDEVPQPSPGAAAVDLVLLASGIAVVVVGSDWLVAGAVGFATVLGVSQSLIGLTVVALGTSLPELATTISATIRNSRLLAIGTLIGSTIYNLTFVLGGSLLFVPGIVGLDPELVRVDIPAMVGAVLLCVPVFVRGRRITRPEGLLFVAAYAGYLTFSIGLRG